ncbi:MAG TPA: M24 family metallopeptidase, partial [Actinomycetaceae bacterium]|nr:M24 family metallopeptidase [Actinomycetaceae bacterium]
MLAERAPLGTLIPGTVSPPREVPPSIERPEYVGKAAPAPFTGSEINDAPTIERIRRTAQLAAQALAEVGRAVRPGITTEELDRIGHEFAVANDAYPSSLGYRGFPKALCTSVNEVICHGIPDSTVLQDGDIVNVDITLFREGVHGDNSATFLVGDVDEESALLVERTRKAMERGIRAVRPGREVN